MAQHSTKAVEVSLNYDALCVCSSTSSSAGYRESGWRVFSKVTAPPAPLHGLTEQLQQQSATPAEGSVTVRIYTHGVAHLRPNCCCRYLAMDSDSVFVDLGCGRGRAVLQVAAHSPAGRVVGLELSASRLEQAEMALQQLQDQGVPLGPVEFKEADLSTCSLTDGTHFYLCSTAFGAGICRCGISADLCMVLHQLLDR